MTKWFRSCVICASRWFGNDLFCETCWKEILRRSPRKMLQRSSEEFQGRHYYLWLWTPASEIIPKVIYSLKKREFRRIQEDILEQLTVRCPLSQMHADEIVYVTREEAQSYDHTQALAKKMGEILNCPVHALYLKEKQENYKSLGRVERLRLRKVKSLKLSHIQQKRVLFIDDVYTSGATAKAAWEALGKPKDYNALTLAFKRYEGE